MFVTNILSISLQHPILASSLSSSIVEVLGKSPHWARRQTYAVLCGEIVKMAEDIKETAEDNKGAASYSAANFSTELLPHLLDLTWDKVSSNPSLNVFSNNISPRVDTQVPNVRLACARVVAALPESYRASCVDLVDTATAQLREDKDPDVRAVMRGDTEEEQGTACDRVIPTFTSLDNVISEVQIFTVCPIKTVYIGAERAKLILIVSSGN